MSAALGLLSVSVFLFYIYEGLRASGLMFSWLCLGAYKPFYLVTLMHVYLHVCVCVCVRRERREREQGREGDARINTKPSGGLLLPEREGTGHPAESAEGESNREGRVKRKMRSPGKREGEEMDAQRRSNREERWMEMGRERRCSSEKSTEMKRIM